MTIGQWQTKAEAQLSKEGIPTSRLDCLVLLQNLLNQDKSWILAHPEHSLSSYQRNRLNKQIYLRKSHLPIAYIIGRTEFYGRTFRVNRHVLEPRPESETMIEILKSLKLPRSPKIADIGTGSGCLGITAALELPGAKVDLYDIDSGALAVARNNAHAYELQLKLHKRDLLRRPSNIYDVVLANLPYVPNDWKINQAAMHEPKIAIYGGKDGLDLYKRLFDQLSSFTWKPIYVLSEALPPQHLKLASIAKAHGFELVKTEDFIQLYQFKS